MQSRIFTKMFLSHPRTVGESWFGHFGVALGFAGWLFLAAGAAVVHALVPALCEHTASRIITKLYTRMSVR